MAAATGANLPVLLQAVGVGILTQVVRAQRVRLMLARQGSIPLFQSFGAMIVGHGIGDLLPLAPGGPVLRCVIIERLAGISVAFSSGVCIAEGMLDVVAPGILVPYVLLAVALPGWARWVLIGLEVQTIVLPVLFAVLGSGLRISPHGRLAHVIGPRVANLMHQVTDGLRAVTPVDRGGVA